MDSKNAIDTIFKIEEMLETLTAKVQILETSMNNLNNKMYVINSKIKGSGSFYDGNPATSVRSDGLEAHSPAPTGSPRAEAPSSMPEISQPSKLVLGNVKVYGYILNKAKRPLKEVYVRVFTDSNEVIKETVSNGDGYWECRLPSGRFSVEYTHKNFKPINVMVEIPNGVTSFEVK